MVKRSKHDLSNPRYMKVSDAQFKKMWELYGANWAEEVRDLIDKFFEEFDKTESYIAKVTQDANVDPGNYRVNY